MRSPSPCFLRDSRVLTSSESGRVSAFLSCHGHRCEGCAVAISGWVELDCCFPSPLATLTTKLLGPFGRSMILLTVAISIFGVLAADLIGAPRAFLSAVQHGILSQWIATIHPRFKTPHAAISIFAISTTGTNTWEFPVGSAPSLSCRVCHCSSFISWYCLATLRLRSKCGNVPGAFRIPFGPTVPVMDAAIILWLMAQSRRAEWLATTGINRSWNHHLCYS